MKKNVIFFIILGIIIIGFSFFKIQKDIIDIQNEEVYLDRGCGLCGGDVTINTHCLFKIKGDSLEAIIESTKKKNANMKCVLMGCTGSTSKYMYCDDYIFTITINSILKFFTGKQIISIY